ncbi:MAG: DUF4339 domain-containing protein [Cyanobacteria bacterium J06641_5]
MDRKGPITPDEARAFIESGKIGPATLVWQEGLEDWVPITETELRDLLPEDLPPPVPTADFATPVSVSRTGATEPMNATDVEARIQQLETWFKIQWICLAAGIPLIIIAIGGFSLIASVVFGAMLLYQFWKLIQDGEARATPGQAVGFIFIPFFNLYWNFVAFWGLAQDLNTYMDQRGIDGPRLNENMALVQCILVCCGIIPYLGILAAIGAAVLWTLNLKAFKDAAIAILRSRITA